MKRPIKLKNGEEVWLADLYNEYNRLYFDGKLCKCRFYTYEGRRSFGMFFCKRWKKNGYTYKLSIGIAKNVD